MNYFCISDVHGCYDKMYDALMQANFDAQNDTLIVLGDSFDRGPNSLEVLNFIMNLPHRIIIRGNHDERLYQLVCRGYLPTENDVYNGVRQTLLSFLPQCRSGSISLLLNILKSDKDGYKVYQRFEQYWNESVYAVEFTHMILTHGWLPYKMVGYTYCSLDYHCAKREEWSDAMWANTLQCILFCDSKTLPNKTLVLGHWFAWSINYYINKELSTVVTDKQNPDCVIKVNNCNIAVVQRNDHEIIAIDGCANIEEGKVNVFKFTSNEKPQLIVAK